MGAPRDGRSRRVVVSVRTVKSMMAIVVVVSVALSGCAAALSQPRPVQEPALAPEHPWFDMSLPRAQRVGALVKAMTLEEKVAQLVVDTPKIERLGVPAYAPPVPLHTPHTCARTPPSPASLFGRFRSRALG